MSQHPERSTHVRGDGQPADGAAVMLFDDSCRGGAAPWGQSHAWSLGGRLYRGLHRLHAFAGASDWETGLRWLVEALPEQPLSEVQLWCHGKWGQVMLGGSPLGLDTLRGTSVVSDLLRQLARRLGGEQALLWLRTCESFGAQRGQQFARELGDLLGCRVAGHTHIIGFWQSGLHVLRPGATPHWSPAEGLARGTAEEPLRARGSAPWRKNTISCLQGAIPAAIEHEARSV